MPRYYCDYCDTYLTHDSPSVRKQHNAGYKHKANVRSYYQQFEEQQTQSLIDQRIKEHLGQTAVALQQQVGGTYQQHLASLQTNPQRARLPLLPIPGMPIPGSAPAPMNAPLLPGMRPPALLPLPIPGAPGYSAAPAMPTMVGAPGASSLPMQQINGVPRPPTLNPPPTASGGMSTPTSSGAGPMFMPGMYQANPTAAASGGFDAFNVSAASALPRVTPTGGASTTANPQDGFSYGQAPEFRDPSLDKSSSQ